MTEGPIPEGLEVNVPDHRLIRVIGAGSFGQVWLAQSATGAYRAVKVVRRKGADGGQDFRRAFKGLRHYEPISREDDHLMDILHVGPTDPTDLFYCVMELADPAPASAEGLPASTPDPVVPERYEPLTLHWLLERRERLPVAESVDLGITLCRAIAGLHRHGLVHRDIKPSNIIFCQGRPKLTDIDLVSPAAGTVVQAGAIGYMPRAGLSTPGADLYSLGKVLYEASTGNDRTRFPIPPEGLSDEDQVMWADLNEVLVRACDEDPDRRYTSAAEMHEDLLLVRSGRSPGRARSVERRLRVFQRAGLAALAGLGVLTAVWVHEAGRNRELARLERESRAHLIQLHLSNARRAIDDGLWPQATLWFTHALEASTDPIEVERLRWRIGALESLSPRIVQMGAHSNSINEVAFAPDGKRFVTGSEDGTARVWDAETGQAVGQAMRHPGAINVVRFSPDGAQVMTAGADGRLRLWQAATGEPVRELMVHGAEFIAAAFSPDGRLVVGAGKDGRARVWNVGDGSEAFEASVRHEHAIWSTEFSPDGRWFVTAGLDGRAVIWSSSDGRPRHAPFVHPGKVQYAAFSPDGRTLVTACADGTARFWDTEAGSKNDLELRHLNLNYVGFSHDGQLVVTTTGQRGEPSEVRVWDASTGQPVGLPVRHDNRVRYAEFSPDDQWLATASHDGIVQITRVGSGVAGVKLAHERAIWSLSFSPDGSRLLTAGATPVWRLWALGAHGRSPYQHNGDFKDNFAELTSDRRWLWSSNEERSQIWRLDDEGRHGEGFEPADGIRLYRSDAEARRVAVVKGLREIQLMRIPEWGLVGPWCHSEAGFSVALPGRDGRSLYVGDMAGTITGWDAPTGSELFPAVQLPCPVIRFLELNRNGTLLLSGGGVDQSPGAVVLLDASTGRVIHGMVTNATVVNVARFSPDEDTIAVGCSSYGPAPTEVRLLDGKDLRNVRTRLPHPDGVGSLDFRNDGRALVTGDEQGTIRVWSIPSGTQLIEPIRCSNGIRVVDFSPNGRLIGAACNDGTTTIWDASTGEPLIPTLRHARGLGFGGFHHEGRWWLTASDDGEVRVWRLTEAVAPVSDLRRRAELDSGVGLLQDGRTRLLGPEELLERWRTMAASQAGMAAVR